MESVNFLCHASVKYLCQIIFCWRTSRTSCHNYLTFLITQNTYLSIYLSIYLSVSLQQYKVPSFSGIRAFLTIGDF